MAFERISFEDYTARKGINASAIAEGVKSMLHMQHHIYSQSADSPAKRWGRLCHLVCLEPETAESRLAIFDGQKRGAKWETFKIENAERECVTEEECEWL